MRKKDKVWYSVSEFYADVTTLAESIRSDARFDDLESIYGIPQGGSLLAFELSDRLNLNLLAKYDVIDSRKTLIVDDLVDSGKTMGHFNIRFMTAVLHRKTWSRVVPDFIANDNCEDWIVYWWEGTQEKSIEDSVIRQLEYIGEEFDREGLVETPKRVVKSWDKIYGGYKLDPRKLMKTFESDGYDQMVLLKDIEFYSTCEHHMLPFFGKAHIAYIPDHRVIGISKLARLLEVFTRRLQIQERIGEQVTSTIDEELSPFGSACILEAQHFCMTSRGVEKQHSKMVTSSLTGVFRKQEVRQELMSLIK